MAVLKYKDIEKMNEKDIKEKLGDLKKELVKSSVARGKGDSKINTKEIKKAIARINSFKNKKTGVKQ